MERAPGRRLQLHPVAWLYVAVIGLLAAAGFVGQTPWPILLAVLVSVPASVVTVPCYYFAFGMLSLLPGGNVSGSSGSGSAGPDSVGVVTESASTAAWFTAVTDSLGIAALVAAALLNVLLVRALFARRTVRPPA